MLSWFKKKPRVNRDYSEVFDWPHDRFAEFTTKLIAGNEPNGRIQLLIALKNLSLTHSAYSSVQREAGKSSTVRDTVERLEEILERQTDEIAIRRLHWFSQAG